MSKNYSAQLKRYLSRICKRCHTHTAFEIFNCFPTKHQACTLEHTAVRTEILPPYQQRIPIFVRVTMRIRADRCPKPVLRRVCCPEWSSQLTGENGAIGQIRVLFQNNFYIECDHVTRNDIRLRLLQTSHGEVVDRCHRLHLEATKAILFGEASRDFLDNLVNLLSRRYQNLSMSSQGTPLLRIFGSTLLCLSLCLSQDVTRRTWRILGYLHPLAGSSKPVLGHLVLLA